ncbi:ninja-family protein AFP3-like [Arachis stenosperma]|uniref:ninja-family protein AFP3-like n=1 Tax=Arachis stenosperma TaxID=217475 RepID=UPI0025ACAAF6|nr:ninja-family protein AFP3-like [Arachis stenosperma]
MEIKEKKWMKRSSSTSSIIYIEENERKEKDSFVPWLERSWSMPSEAVMMKCRDMCRTAKILLLHEQNRRGAAAPSVLPSSAHVIDRVKKLLAAPNGDSKHEVGESSSKIKTSPTGIKGYDPKKSSKQPTLQKMSSSAKRLKAKKNRSSCVKGDNNKGDNNKNNNDDAMEILRHIPSVSTRGDGPSGKRIEGILYKYNRGQVCIVCVCHGKFLTPSEFVMHAGGSQVDNPMKHITVSSNNSI